MSSQHSTKTSLSYLLLPVSYPVADHFSIVIRFDGVCYEGLMAMRYKFNLVTYVQRLLVIDRRGGTERNLNEITTGNR